MKHELIAKPLTKAAFASFGDVIERSGAEQRTINEGRCTRFHDLAQVETRGEEARTLINIFAPIALTLPIGVNLVERHPLGSQAFVPLSADPFLVVVCEDENGVPLKPHAFITDGQQGVNYRANIWHAPLIALAEKADFVVIDRGGDGVNLEEYTLDEPLVVSLRD